MKRLASILLILGVLLSLAACTVSPVQGDETTAESAGEATQAATESGEETSAESSTEAPAEVSTEAPAAETTEAPTDGTDDLPPPAEAGGMLVRTLEGEIPASSCPVLVRDYTDSQSSLADIPAIEYPYPEVSLEKGPVNGHTYTASIPELGLSAAGEYTRSHWDEGYHNPVDMYQMVHENGSFSIDRVTGKVVKFTWDTDVSKELPTISDEERERVAEEYKAKVLAMLGVEDMHTLWMSFVLSAGSQGGGMVYRYTFVHEIAGLNSIDRVLIHVNEYGEFLGYATFLLGGMAGVTMPEDFSEEAVMDAMMALWPKYAPSPPKRPSWPPAIPLRGWYFPPRTASP